MQSLLSEVDIEDIKNRLTSLPSGPFEVTSIGVKNYLLWAGGTWEDEYDLPIHHFFSHAKNDVENLIGDLEFYKHNVDDLREQLKSAQELLEKKTIELENLKLSIEDDGR